MERLVCYPWIAYEQLFKDFETRLIPLQTGASKLPKSRVDTSLLRIFLFYFNVWLIE